MAGETEENTRAIACAALTICESLIITLRELGVLSESEIDDLLTDAASAQCSAADGDEASAIHRASAALIRKIREGKNAI
ncbi:MAG: hypothetical protein GEU92_06180 [Alphaproteobacteria bacterium]|nr:hypothetical protein [Alphaproteobacteria bacterium]